MAYDQQDYRRASIIVGILFIIATAFLFLGEMFYRPLLDDPEVLSIAASHKPIIVFGLLIELVCILAMPLIGAFIFPVLSQVSIGIALSYFFFRAFEGITLVTVALMNKFAILSLSEAVAAGADPTVAEGALLLIQAQNLWGNTDGQVYNIIFALGAALLYATLYRSRLIPRWISVWGLLAVATLFGAVLASIFVEISPTAEVLLLIPIGVQEIVMALWLIFCGFEFGSLNANARNAREVAP